MDVLRDLNDTPLKKFAKDGLRSMMQKLTAPSDKIRLAETLLTMGDDEMARQILLAVAGEATLDPDDRLRLAQELISVGCDELACEQIKLAAHCEYSEAEDKRMLEDLKASGLFPAQRPPS